MLKMFLNAYKKVFQPLYGDPGFVMIETAVSRKLLFQVIVQMVQVESVEDNLAGYI